MKKSLLTLTMLIATIFSAIAQQDGKSWETAIDIVAGENSSNDLTTVRTYYSGAYFKYTATENTIVTVNGIQCSSLNFYDENHAEMSSAYSAIGSTYYYSAEVEAGKTIYIIANLAYGETGSFLSFNAQIDKGDTLHGNSADDPRIIEDGNTYWFKGNYHAYMTYTATEDGVLELGYKGSSDYGSTSTVDGVATAITLDTSDHVYRVSVKAGKTYSISLYCASYSMFSVSVTLTHPQKGDTMDNPFDMTLGENAIPTTAGKYWYSFTNGEKAGFLTLTATGATINVRTAGYSYDDLASNQSGMAKVEVSANATILVALIKTTEDPTVISAEFAEPALGEIEGNPIVITEASSTVEIPAATTLYYSISTADESCFLNAKVLSGWNNNSSCMLKTTADSYYQYSFTESSALHYQTAKNTTYILKLQNAGTETLQISIWKEEIAQGDFMNDPITAVLGENTILPVGGTDKYFVYKAEKSFRLDITVPEGVTVKFPYDYYGYEYYYDPAKVDGNTYSYFVTEGKDLVFKLTGTQPRQKFTLTEGVAAPGESRATAIEYTEPYTLQNMPGTVWLVYNATADGVVNIKADLKNTGYYDYIYYYVNDEETEHSISVWDYNLYAYKYDGNASVSAGDKVYVQVIMKTNQNGNVITMTMREPAPGEAPSKPIVITPDTETTIGAVAWGGTPTWYSFTAKKAGTVKFVASDYMSMNLCNPTNPSVNLLDSDTSFGGSYYGDYEYEVAEAGTYLVKVTYTYGCTLTLSGSAFEDTTTGIKINENVNENNVVYNLAGQRINGVKKGVVIVNGKKVLVK